MFEYNHGSVLWERFFMGTDNSTAAAIVAMTGMIAYVVFVVLATDVAQKKQSMETVITPFSFPLFLQQAPSVALLC